MPYVAGDRSTFHFFWHGPFSQWAPVTIEVEGQTYNTCEQYMMACKARIFNDPDVERLIMATAAPAEQKKLGRRVKGFDPGIWSLYAREIVYAGNLAKFTQHPDLKQILEATGDRTIVEASPYDRIWGIGMAEDDHRAPYPAQWQGTNWLGECIERVRETIRGTE